MKNREATKIIDYLRTHATDQSTALAIVLDTHRNYLIRMLIEYQGGDQTASRKPTTPS